MTIPARQPARIREVVTEADLETLVTLTNVTTPDDPTSLEELRWSDATYPGTSRFLADIEGRAVGIATVGRIFMYPPGFPDLWATIVVAPEARRRGIGEALLVAVSERAGAAGKTGLQLRASEARPDGISFLEHRGFRVIERSKTVRLDLRGLDPPTIEAPAGVVLTTLADRPDLVPGVHAVALEAFADIPGGDTPDEPGDLPEFRARDVDRPGIPAGAFTVALDAASGAVVGYASLMFVPGSATVAWHDMTAVRRRWRGRGIATVLKRATVAWAIGHGLTDLETGNDEANGPMRAVNARLGYQPLPDEVFFRGPLFSVGA